MENVLHYLSGVGYYVMGLGVPLAMVVAMVAFAWPVLRGSGELTPPRRAAASVLALMCLLSGLSSLPSALSGSPLGLILVGLLIIPAIFTLVRLHQTHGSGSHGGYGGY
ncbi:hypothetical protein [Kocuria aegyptia]|uniref:DUF805 domain-containing protein n=1 Tax=Kocuria aegyptia TaxID=330943 RepID=A0ABP4W5B0_9MICC